MKFEEYGCQECGEPFTEFDEEEADLYGYPYDPDHRLCPSCYQEQLEKVET